MKNHHRHLLHPLYLPSIVIVTTLCIYTLARVNLSLQLKHRPWVHLFCISSHESHVLGGVGFLLTIEEIEVGVKKGRVTFS